MNDLFDNKSMHQRVLEFCRLKRGFINSIDIEGLKENIIKTEGHIDGILRIHREFRNLARTEKYPDKPMRRLELDEKKFRNFPNPNIAIYEWVGEKKPIRWTDIPVTQCIR